MKHFCKQCGAETTKRVCLPCGAFRTRLCRALKSLKDGGEPHIVTDYHKLTDEEKANFRKKPPKSVWVVFDTGYSTTV